MQNQQEEVDTITRIKKFREFYRQPVPEDATESVRRYFPPEDILDRLRKYYTADEVPPCRVCGGELSPQRFGGGEPTVYGHSAPEGVPLGDWMEHYQESKWTQYRQGDFEVLALVELVEKLSENQSV